MKSMALEGSSRPVLCCGCVEKLAGPCRGFFRYFTLGHPVHPVQQTAPNNSEFINLGPKIRIRVIHVKPGNEAALKEAYPCFSFNSKRLSLSEEYWFTRWNKPLKSGICNCSFRRSLRYSAILDVKSDANTNRLSNFDLPATRITNVDTFVERLVQETLFEALQEYVMSKNVKLNPKSVKEGVSNASYQVSEDDADGVFLRGAKSAAVLPTDCITVEIRENSERKRAVCEHKSDAKKVKKPLIFLLHGIGCTADFWWIIIKSLLSRGYEIVAPDMLGHGFSSAPDKKKAYTFKSLLKQTTLIFDNYVGAEESKRCIVIGHSFGCSLAAALYRSRSQQITQLVLISGGGPTPLAPPARDVDTPLMDILQFFIKPLLLCGMKRSLFYSLRGKHLGPCETNNAVPNYVLKYIKEGQHWPEGDAAFHRRILVPTLLVHGLQDTKITLVQECEMERTIPRAFLELIPNAGHMSLLETPEHLTHMILCFIDWWSH